MCGIAVYIGEHQEQAKAFVMKANQMLSHRGPDGEGIYTEEGVALAHRRLSILDLSAAGSQPMHSSDDRYVIVHNGEIYNHLELRKKYLSGHVFKGHSDTETLVELFALKREQMLAELIGMWAFAIWDKRERKVLISRDRFGQKPLFWKKMENGSIAFASEIKPLLGGKEEVNYTALVEYLATGNYGHITGQTFFKNIHTVLPASYCYVDLNERSINALLYWTIPVYKESERRVWDKEMKTLLHDAVVEAVLSQTLSDVPIGITLSGGIDSSIVAGILFKYYGQRINVFTAQTPGDRHNEMPYVEAVLKRASAEQYHLHKFDLHQLSLKENLERYIDIQEEPFGDPSIIAHGILMQQAAGAGCKVLLGGQGADELFFGYNNFVNYLLAQQLRKGKWNKFVSSFKSVGYHPRQFTRLMLMAYLPSLEKNMRIKSRKQRRAWLDKDWISQVNDEDLFWADYSDREEVWKESLSHVHLPHLLLYDDHNSMAVGVETRTPFLDHRLYEIVARIKSDDMLTSGIRKYILRDACKEYLPQEILNRRDKIGFYTPLADMMNKEKGWVESVMRSESSAFAQDDVLIKYRKLSSVIWSDLFIERRNG